MTLLIFGLLLFLGVHSVRVFADGGRTSLRERLGDNGYKGLYSVLSLLGFALLIWGYGAARQQPVLLWVPPAWTRHLAALLTILGYSVNDTVVIFDRLRENLIKYKTMPLRDLLNFTANETLSRTLMTATTTLIALTVLLILGGDVIRGFVFAMLFGVIIGTYSTLYVAKNIVLMLGVNREPKEKRDTGSEFANIDA